MNIIGINPPGPSLPIPSPSETSMPPSSLTPEYTRFKGKIQNFVLKTFRKSFGGQKTFVFQKLYFYQNFDTKISSIKLSVDLKQSRINLNTYKINNNEFVLNLKSTRRTLFSYIVKKDMVLLLLFMTTTIYTLITNRKKIYKLIIKMTIKNKLSIKRRQRKKISLNSIISIKILVLKK